MKIKKLAAVTITICILISIFSFSASAAGNPISASESNLSFLSEVGEKTVQVLLNTIIPEKELYGLGNVDFSDLSLGREIPAYELTVDGIKQIENIHYFPVISDGKWVATSKAFIDADGNMQIEVSTDYVNEYVELLSSNDEGIALVFTDTEAYLYAGDDSATVETYGRISERISLDDYAGEININTTSLEKESTLSVGDIIQKEVSVPSIVDIAQVDATTLPSIVALAVPSVVQQGTYTCWAACVTSIANYYGQNKTESDVWAYAGITNGNSSTAAKTATYAASVLSSSSFGSLDYGKYGNSGNFYDNMYLENVITETYYNSSPIFAVFQGSSAVGHAVVIRGYVTSDTINTIVYMDPDSGSFKASTVTTSSKMTIVVSGETYNFNRGFAVYG